MSDAKINPKILTTIRQNSQGDDLVADFLKELVYEEAEHTPGWWWRKTYRKKVKKYSNQWRGRNED